MDLLTLTPSYRPILLTRAVGQSPLPHGEPRNCDATKTAEVAAALAGVDLVVNCTAGSPRTIVVTTKALCDAARRNPPRRIVHLSSMAVYGGAEGIVDERSAPVPPLNAYARARIECEALVQQYITDGGNAAIIRSSCVFGPGSETWGSRIARLLLSRRLGDLGRLGDGLCNLIHVDDLVGLIIATLSASDASGETFNASADWPRPTWNDFLIRFARAIGAIPVERITARRMRVEVGLLAPLLRGAALAAGRVGAGRFIPDEITPSFLRLLGQNITVSGAKASAIMGITHRPLDQAIDETAQWWRSQMASAAGDRSVQDMPTASDSQEVPSAAFESASRSAAANEARR
jgi:nucleoside-diphosphate-sugar epimerase